jgi:branched-subunit amino acid transport protein
VVIGAQRSEHPMSWTLVLVLAAGAYGFKALGLVVLGDRPLPSRLERCLALIPAALLAALIVSGTFADGKSLAIDPRAAGVAVAVIAAWRRANLIVVIVLAAAVTAAVRAIT